MEVTYDIFISHPGEFKVPWAIPLKEMFTCLDKNLKAFVDESDLKPGDNAPSKMSQAAQSAKVFLVLVDQHFFSIF